MLLLISLIIAAYVVARLVIPLPLGVGGKILLSGIILLIACKHMFMFFCGGLASPELPVPILIIINWLFGALLLLFFLLIIKDAVGLVLWCSGKLGLKLALPFSRMQWAAGLSLLAMLLAAYGMWQAIKAPAINTMEVVVPRLPKGLDGLSLVQITDMHTCALFPAPRTQAIVELTNSLHPDIILFTGDMIDGTVENRSQDVAPLRELKATYGIYGSLGNHEYYSGLSAWRRAFAGLGIVMLENSHTVLNIKDNPLVIVGVTDPVAAQFRQPVPDIEKALAGAPHGAVRILLAHQPKEALNYARAEVDLQLSGHTHGGLIVGLTYLVQKFNAGFVAGWYEVGATRLYVSSGAGLWNGLPLRLGVPAEITHIILRCPD